ncbi:hypothetical protein [Arcobacter sp. FWKO B]|uniref:hypothetical protein n=1 Tax=Arcobacter sp. FWKO B TaxID=2593672 RepID=UPI0018A35256|nr:hypothetical protein [Arcobacter sp. FWKO B]QOG11638.1 hypothetical protein FWKOB_02505 [Arcobacter sp. FWKO B]
MYSIKLDVNDNMYDKFMLLVSNISTKDIKIKEIQKTDNPKVKNPKDLSSLGGILNKYADVSKIDLEAKAWELHIADKYK